MKIRAGHGVRFRKNPMLKGLPPWMIPVAVVGGIWFIAKAATKATAAIEESVKPVPK